MRKLVLRLFALLLLTIPAYAETVVYVDASSPSNVYLSGRGMNKFLFGVTPQKIIIPDRITVRIKVQCLNPRRSRTMVIHGGLGKNVYELYFDVNKWRLRKTYLAKSRSYSSRPRGHIIYSEHNGHGVFDLNICLGNRRVKIWRRW